MPVVLWVFNILIMTSILVEDTGLKENEEFLEILLFFIIIIIIVIIIIIIINTIILNYFSHSYMPSNTLIPKYPINIL